MPKNTIALMLAGLLVVAISPAEAYQVANKTVKVLHVNSGGGFYFETNEAMLNPDACTNSGFYHIARDTKFEKEIYAMLLATYTTGASITFYLDGCEANYPKVIWMRTQVGTP